MKRKAPARRGAGDRDAQRTTGTPLPKAGSARRRGGAGHKAKAHAPREDVTRADPHKRGLRDPRTRATQREALRRAQPGDAREPAPRLNSEPRLRSKEPLHVGDWLWTTREGSERDVVEELMLAGKPDPRGLGPALVASRAAPGEPGARLDLTFARQGFLVASVAQDAMVEALAAKLVPALVSMLADSAVYALQVFVPDSPQGNLLAPRAKLLERALFMQLAVALPHARREADPARGRMAIPLVQACLFAVDEAAAGIVATDQALSLAEGGRARMRLAGEFPSRAARKLEEAFSWLGVSPGPGELCVDLGAAPGGWSWLLLERRARVIAVDPARMDAKLMQNRRLQHVQGSAFDFAPEETADWLFCDMAWRPLEVAEMLGRWARRRYTRLLVANFKLPMKRKAEMVQRLRAVLHEGGYIGLRTRQLYHDRDEITLTARVR